MHALFLASPIARLTAEIATSDPTNYIDLAACADLLKRAANPTSHANTLVDRFLTLAFSPHLPNSSVVNGHIRDIAAILAAELKDLHRDRSSASAVHILLTAVASGDDLILATKRAILSVKLSTNTSSYYEDYLGDSPVSFPTPIGCVSIDRLHDEIIAREDDDALWDCYRVALDSNSEHRPSIKLDDARYATLEMATKVLFDILTPVKTAA